ncbi:MAG: AAA family ATPase [Candidatus Tectimicrobiota bacterium]
MTPDQHATYVEKVSNLWRGMEQKYGPLKDVVEVDPQPTITFETIGGLEEAKRELEVFGLSLLRPELHQKWGTEPSKGVILYGPPGTGKSLLVKALANRAEAVELRVVVPNLIIQTMKIPQKWEEFLKDLYALMEEFKRTIVHLDDIDLLGSDYEQLFQAMKGVVVQLTPFLLEIVDRLLGQDNTIVVSSTTRLDLIKPQFIKPGRFERIIEVALPDQAARREIFQLQLWAAEKRAGRPLAGEVDFNAVAEHSHELSGADITEVVRRCLEEKVILEGAGQPAPPISSEDLQRSITTVLSIKDLAGTIRTNPSLYL